DAVVGDVEFDMISDGETQRATGGTRMAHDIVQRLRRNAVGGNLHRGRQRAVDTRQVERHLYDAVEAAGELGERSGYSLIVQRPRAPITNNQLHLARRSVDLIGKSIEQRDVFDLCTGPPKPSYD